MNITVLAKKGGIGKTQTCLLLHEALRQAGKTVRVHDWNSEQGTFTKAFRSIYGKMPPVSGEFEYNIWDTPPSEPADTWETDAAVSFVLEKNPKATLRVVFNKVQKGRLLTRFVEDHIKTLKAVTLPVMLNTRECYKHAIAQGWSVLDNGAREEAFQLALAVASLSVNSAHK